MKLRYLFTLVFILLLAACGPAGTGDTTPAATTASDPDNAPRPTVTSIPQDNAGATPESYPIQPTAPSGAAGYPAGEAPVLATVNPYPAVEGFVWMVKPVGLQCEDPQLATLQDAVAELTAANITLNDSTTQEFSVCQACGCPTSTYYRVQIPTTDQATAESLGWQSVSEE